MTSRYDYHVFICGHERAPDHTKGSCAAKDSLALVKRFKQAVKQAGLSATVRAQKAGCLDLCAQGPTVVVYPEGVWYVAVRAQDVETIVNEHLVKGQPVESLRYRPSPSTEVKQ